MRSFLWLSVVPSIMALADARAMQSPALARSADTIRLELEGEFRAVVAPVGANGRPLFEAAFRQRGTSGDVFIVQLARYGAGLPEVGDYALAPLNRADPGGRFYATYRQPPSPPGDTARAYVSTRGALSITESSPERIAGTLRFTGAEYSARWPTGNRGSGSPTQPSADLPTIEVRARFLATPLVPEFVCVGTGGPSVVVEVRDQAGRPAATGARLFLEDGAFRDSAGPAASWDGVHLGAGERRPGRYTVRVTKPGFRPVVLAGVAAPPTGNPRCGYAEPTGVHRVTLELLSNAPAVRSVVVSPPAMGLHGIPGTEHQLVARVDAAPGRSTAVRWSSSDPTLLAVRATSDSTAVVVPQCRATGGDVTITASARADSRVRGTATISVDAPTDTRGLGPPDVKAMADACLIRLGRGR